ncbi:YkgB family protein [Klebsiella sp. BIGb0407]|uniref:YkgB family protein n=1 Tax=Klebsiella sp. BIGb0407 TaxID=2940603 RepID=UPI0021680771|nr:YkgB family protein [Klebsiella sp. BIGb0407]MCS3431968.1 putative membrane protein YkgB [Klebsiella sp. BIGb0407]
MSYFLNKLNFVVAEKNSGSYKHLSFLRWSLVVVFFWFGGMKFTEYEALGIAPFIENSPIMSWLHVLFGVQGASYFLGAAELTTGVLLITGAFNALFSALGAFMSSMTFLVTITFFITTPGVFESSLGGFPAISAGIGQFLLKDLVLLAASLCLLISSVKSRDPVLEK